MTHDLATLHARLDAADSERRQLGDAVADVGAAIVRLERLQLGDRLDRLYALAEVTAARVARLDEERERPLDMIAKVRTELDDRLDRTREELAELRGRVGGADDTGRHAALVVEAAIRGSRPDAVEARPTAPVEEDKPAPASPSKRPITLSWTPTSARDWRRLAVYAVVSLGILSVAVQQLVQLLAGR